ncbi:hypothetical protein ANI_1_1754184 [Paecilomyces variotii No. 5]|uniref:Prolyl 4-hydroxylase alpha subunit domain-containing protein n=1 Tax=Byssochlamys spectabilis (strain No. 5 / NBRC 109023) TaxID=1356009 RepID=V5G2H2_BYSSN|nr:hypothetical protein ANI_1_1754184 [Paecilomyces variotii No. 5]
MAWEPPPDFLPAAPPKEACMRRIDWESAGETMKLYKDFMAFTIDNAFTESECQELIKAAEASTITPDSPTPTWKRAMINAGRGKEVMVPDSRNCGRILYNAPDVAEKIMDRLRPFFIEAGVDTIYDQGQITGLGPLKRNETMQMTRLNELLRFLKYEGGEYFREHCDGSYVTPDEKERSLFTVHLYLNGDGEQDLNELAEAEKRAKEEEEEEEEEEMFTNIDHSGKLLGGATSFHPFIMGSDDGDDGGLRVFPKTGSVLLFQQRNLCHAGDDVYRGVKYTIRTEIMYRKVDQS